MNKIIKGLIVCVIGVICMSELMSNTFVQASASKSNTEMNISSKKEIIYIGQKYKLRIDKDDTVGTGKSVKWKSSDKEIATVNQSGTVTGISEGVVTITAISKSDSKIRCSCEMKVQKFSNKKVSYKPIIVQNDSEQKLGYSVNKSIRRKMRDQNLLISTYSELQKLKKLIKKNYDYPELVLKQLKKYNRKFFCSKSLYYTNAAVIIPSKFEIIKVEKEMIKGKVVCSITVNDIYTPPSTSGPTTDIRGKSANNEYIVELKKKNIKDVERFRLIHKHITKYSD